MSPIPSPRARRLVPVACRFFPWFIGLVLACSPALAQFQRGTLLGTVTDTSGAVIAGATVTVKNLGTDEVRTAPTDERGDYTFPSLLPGRYSVTSEVSGFKTQVVSDIQLQVNQTARINLQMSVGEVVERIEAVASLQLLKTDTSDLGSVIPNKTIVDLPLNGRDYLQLARLIPGAVPSRAGATAGAKGVSRSINIAGARDTSVSYLLDGVDTNDQAFQTPTVTPSVDAIQEFKVLTHTYSAEFGRGSTQIITALKSGTNQLHGTLFEFNRNNSFAARSFFQPGSVARLNYNQFGGTFGGPVVFPKLYQGRDRTFFFLNYEGSRQRSGGTSYAYVPSTAMRSGDFSAPGNAVIYDPATWNPATQTRSPFPNNVIPTNRISSVAGKLAALWPTANVTGLTGRNYAAMVPGIDDTNNANARIDHRVSDKDSIFARYSILDRARPAASVMPYNGIIDQVRGQNAAFNWVHIFSATLLNEVRVGFNRAKYFTLPIASPTENPSLELLGWANTTADPMMAYGLPQVTFTGGWTGMGPGQQYPSATVTQTYQFVDNLTWIRGAHTLKGGFDVRRTRLTSYNSGTAPRGQVDFTGQYTNLPSASSTTGSSVADMLLGFPKNIASSAGDGVAHNYNNLYSFYFQDDWKATSNLTVNLGVRYEYASPWVEKLDRFFVIDPQGGGRLLLANSTLAYVPGKGTVESGLPKTSRSLLNPDRNNFAPRVGLAYRPGSKTVVRSGFGIFHDVQEGNEAQFLRMGPPFYFPQSLSGDPFVPSYQLDKLFPAPTSPSGAISPFVMDAQNRTPYVMQWDFAVEREVASNLLVELAYVGSGAKKILRRTNFQQGANILVRDPANPAPLAQRVDYPNFSNNNILGTDNGGSMTYHGVMGKLERRFSSGFAFTFSYAFGRSIDDGSSSSNFDNTPANPQCRCDMRSEKGVSAYQIQQRAVMSYVYELPFGKGRRFFQNSGAVEKVVGGWQINGITSLQTGPPFTLVTGVDNANIGSTSGCTLVPGSVPAEMACALVGSAR